MAALVLVLERPLVALLAQATATSAGRAVTGPRTARVLALA